MPKQTPKTKKAPLRRFHVQFGDLLDPDNYDENTVTLRASSLEEILSKAGALREALIVAGACPSLHLSGIQEY